MGKGFAATTELRCSNEGKDLDLQLLWVTVKPVSFKCIIFVHLFSNPIEKLVNSHKDIYDTFYKVWKRWLAFKQTAIYGNQINGAKGDLGFRSNIKCK